MKYTDKVKRKMIGFDGENLGKCHIQNPLAQLTNIAF